MDEVRREALLARMRPVKNYNGGVAPLSMPLITLEEYFDGAEGEAGLLCNSSVDLDNDAILKGLQSLRRRPEVHDVRVALVQCDDDEWPFSDKIVVVTAAGAEEILQWLPEGFEPDETWEGMVAHLPCEPLEIPRGYKAVWLWYD
jgi:hypothetical protein